MACITKVEDTRAQQKWQQDVRHKCSSGKCKQNTTQNEDFKVLKLGKTVLATRRIYLKVYLRQNTYKTLRVEESSFFRVTANTRSGLKNC